jgi:hypothetical protein
MAKDNYHFFIFNADGKLKSTIETYNIHNRNRRVLNNLRQNGVNLLLESTQTIGHFNYEGYNAFGNYLSDKLAPL